MGAIHELAQVIVDYPGDGNRVALKQRHPPGAENPVLQHRVTSIRTVDRPVESQVNAVMAKLGARNRTEVVLRCPEYKRIQVGPHSIE
jgi:hypothetical protein